MQSSIPDIYAIGEVAEFKGNIYGTSYAAQEQAQTLAKHLLNNPEAYYQASLGFNILKISNFNLCTIGKTSNLDDSYQEIILYDKYINLYKKCIIKDDKLQGAILIGDTSQFSYFKDLIASQLELADKRKTLFKWQL